MARKNDNMPALARNETAECRPEPTGVDTLRSRILTVRGVQVMLDRDLAELYGVPTKALNQAVKRNIERFPAEFMFALQVGEMSELVTNCDRFKRMKHSSVPMRAFTEYGIIMLASVLKSNIATMVSIRITRAFVAIRRTLATLAPLLSRIEATERRQLRQEDAQVRTGFPEPSRQEVLCLFVARQVQHPRYHCQNMTWWNAARPFSSG